jgi:predicted nucleic acid-binding protein
VTLYVLDTCLISERNRPRPDSGVADWVQAQRLEDLFLTSVVVGELAEGIERMPSGRRRNAYAQWLDRMINVEFDGRMLAFDTAAARLYGRMVAGSYRKGRPPDMGDAQIAAVAAVHGMTIATRDIGGFEPFGVPLVNPWE